jgi:hypothetical protein
MMTLDYPPRGHEMLDAVTERWSCCTSVISPQAGSDNTRMMGDDLLVCMLSVVYTDVEKTMIEPQRSTIVQETRSTFQNALQKGIH